MLHKEIFTFFAKIYFSSNVSESDKCTPKSFFSFANNILQSAEMEHIAENKRNYNRLKKLSVSKLRYYERAIIKKKINLNSDIQIWKM